MAGTRVDNQRQAGGEQAGTVGCLFVASSGGHLFELLQLRDGWAREQRHWVTFDTPDARSLLSGEAVTFAAHPTNRNLPNLVRNFFLAIRLLRRKRPRAILTTGAGVAVPFCWLGRLRGSRIVYIESFARVDSPSLTGRLVHPVAHDFFVQWPEVCQFFPKAKYRGALF